MRHENGGRAIHLARVSQSKVPLNRGINLGHLGCFNCANFLHVRGGKRPGERGLYLACRAPVVLLFIKRPLGRLKLPSFRSGIGPERGLVRMAVHIQREIAMYQVNLATGDVVIHELLRRRQEELPTLWALVIGEDFDGNRRLSRARRF